MGIIIFSGINWLLIVTGTLGVVGIIFLIPAVIIGAVLISKEKDEIKKKAKIKKGIIFSIIPFGLVMFALIGVVVIQAIKALLTEL